MTTIDVPVQVQDLPLWMRRAQRRVDWGALLCFALSLMAAWPFLLQPGLPRTNATENYVFRTNDYAQALSEGIVYPRWSPNAFGGYGAPIPSYLAPAPAYVPALIQFFFTNDPVNAVRVVYIFSVTIAGAAVYAFVTRRTNAAAGLLASSLYVFSPYVSMQAPQILGDLPSCMVIALLPSLLWATDRLLSRDRPLDTVFVAFFVAALILTQPSSMIPALGIVVCYAVWFLWQQERSIQWRWLVVAIAAGAGISAFFWLPALAEQDAVAWQRNGSVTPLLITLRGLLEPLRPIDLNELVPTPQLTLGLALVVFTAAGVGSALYFRARALFQSMFLLLGFALITVALLLIPDETWLLGPIALCLSIGGTAMLLWNERTRSIYFPLLIIASLALSMTGWFAPRWSDTFGSADALAQVQHEQLGYGVAVVPYGQPVPTTLSPALPPDQTLINSFSADTVRKLAIQSGVQVGVLGHTAHSDSFQIDVQTPATVRLLTAYFPGWTASLNTTSVALSADPGTGLINIDFPARVSGELVVTLGATPVRSGGWLVAAGALGVLLLITARRLRHTQDAYEELQLLTLREARLVAVVIASCALLIFAFTSPASSMSIAARPGYGLDGSIELHSRTDVGLEALSYRLDAASVRAGDTVTFTVYWRALRFLPANYQAHASLINLASGETVTTAPLHVLGNYPSQRWLTNRYVTDLYSLRIPDHLQPGAYGVAIQVFNCAATCVPENRLTFFNESGSAVGQALVLPSVLTLVP